MAPQPERTTSLGYQLLSEKNKYSRSAFVNRRVTARATLKTTMSQTPIFFLAKNCLLLSELAERTLPRQFSERVFLEGGWT